MVVVVVVDVVDVVDVVGVVTGEVVAEVMAEVGELEVATLLVGLEVPVEVGVVTGPLVVMGEVELVTGVEVAASVDESVGNSSVDEVSGAVMYISRRLPAPQYSEPSPGQVKEQSSCLALTEPSLSLLPQ